MFYIRFNPLLLLAALTSMNANSHNVYVTPVFYRFLQGTKNSNIIPEINKMYKEYAQKNHFPGYSFGIMVDGKLIYVGL